MFTATSPKHPCAAIASTIQHDAHQLTIHGSCDEAMAQAANRLVAIGGGFVVVADGARADLLVVDGDPLQDLGLLDGQGAHLMAIVKGGEFHKNLVQP